MPKFVGYPDEDLTSSQAGEKLVKIAKERLEHGRQYRQTEREKAWLRSEAQFEGKHWTGGDGVADPSADLVTVNISFSTVTTIVPYVTGSDPRFLVEPYSTDATVGKARAQAAWLNRYWRTTDSGARRAVEQSTLDHLIYGDGYGKVNHALTGEEGVERTDISVERLSPWDVWLDPFSDGLYNARWVCQRIRTTFGELEADPSYSNLADLELGLNTAKDGSERSVKDRAKDVTAAEGDKAYSWVEIYEYWDLVSNEMIVFSTSADLPLKVISETKCPIVTLENNLLPNSPYHMGDLEQIYSLQMELNKSRSQMITHRRRNITKFVIREDAWNAQAEAALTSEVIGEVAKIKSSEPLGSIFATIAPSGLSADAYNVSDLIERDVNAITGVNEYLRGVAPQIRKTATEASIIEGASNIKAAHKLARVETFVRDLGTTVLAVGADMFPITAANEEELFITGKDAEVLNKAEQADRVKGIAERGIGEVEPAQLSDIVSKEVQGSDIYGDATVNVSAMFGGVYQVEVVQNSTELRNPIFKEQKYREMAQQLTAAVPQLMELGVTINLQKAYELWFEAAGIQDVDDMFSPAQNPAAGFPAQAQPGPVEQPGVLQGPGLPNLDAIGAPSDLLTAENTGALPSVPS